MRRIAGAALVLGLAITGFVLLREGPARGRPTDSPAAATKLPSPGPDSSASPGAVPSSTDLDPARIVFRGGDKEAIRKLAAEFRRRARTEPAFRRRLAALLADDAEAKELRQVAAFVLGSLPDAEAQQALALALAGSRETGWSRTLILALGSSKDWGEDDDAFDLEGSPWVVEEPPGLAVRINSVIDDAGLRAGILGHLKDDAGVRDAVALALFFSMSHGDARKAFLAALPGEADQGVQGTTAKALAEWAAAEPSGSEDRRAVVLAILDEGRRIEAVGLRFRSEQGLVRSPMTEPEVRVMSSLLDAGDFDQRRWAIAVLGAKAAHADLPARGDLFSSFERIFSRDGDAKMREFAATALASFPDSARAGELLVAGLSDPAWHVRVGAARALAQLRRKDDAILAALKKASEQDADEHVRGTAGLSLKLLGR